MTNGYKQTNGNGVIHSPLPPDGMYHVSENGHGLMDHNGSATHLAATLTDKVSLYTLKTYSHSGLFIVIYQTSIDLTIINLTKIITLS